MFCTYNPDYVNISYSETVITIQLIQKLFTGQKFQAISTSGDPYRTATHCTLPLYDTIYNGAGLLFGGGGGGAVSLHWKLVALMATP